MFLHFFAHRNHLAVFVDDIQHVGGGNESTIQVDRGGGRVIRGMAAVFVGHDSCVQIGQRHALWHGAARIRRFLQALQRRVKFLAPTPGVTQFRRQIVRVSQAEPLFIARVFRIRLF